MTASGGTPNLPANAGQLGAEVPGAAGSIFSNPVFGTLEGFFITAALTALTTFVKNPSSAAMYKDVLVHIYTVVAQILGGLGVDPNAASASLKQAQDQHPVQGQ